jgi:hypothetical protein
VYKQAYAAKYSNLATVEHEIRNYGIQSLASQIKSETNAKHSRKYNENFDGNKNLSTQIKSLERKIRGAFNSARLAPKF